MAALNIIDLGRQWTKSVHGLDMDSSSREMSRDVSFCAHTIQRRPDCGVLVVPDTLEDSRFKDLPSVREMGIRFYAGAPIVSPEGAVLGALCVFDNQPHPGGLTVVQQKQLQNLADCAMAAMVMES
jgi:GAF domain-containing protein